MSNTSKKRWGNEFWNFASRPDQILLGVVTFVAFFTSLLGAVPWVQMKCFFEEQRSERCLEARSDFKTSLILFLLGILSLSSIIERYKKFEDLEISLEKLKKMMRDASFKQQIISINGSKEWYETAYKMIDEAQPKGYIYDASLSSRTWYFGKGDPEREKFEKIREKAFQDKEKDTRYLFTVKSYLEKERFDEYVKELTKDGSKEYDLQIYEQKLDADIQRLRIVSDRLERAGEYPNHAAAYLPDIKLRHPILSFLVVDGKKVLLGFYLSEFQESDVNKDGALLIDNEEIAALFTAYFDFLWERASIQFAHDSGKTGQLKKILEQLEKQLDQLKGSVIAS
jgi:hypothetical protein